MVVIFKLANRFTLGNLCVVVHREEMIWILEVVFAHFVWRCLYSEFSPTPAVAGGKEFKRIACDKQITFE